MTVDTEITSRKSPASSDEVELLEFLAERHACDDWDREIVCSEVKAFSRGIKNALLAVTPFWLAVAWWLAG